MLMRPVRPWYRACKRRRCVARATAAALHSRPAWLHPRLRSSHRSKTHASCQMSQSRLRRRCAGGATAQAGSRAETGPTSSSLPEVLGATTVSHPGLSELLCSCAMWRSFGPRDVTPEAIRPLIEREAPGLVHALIDSAERATAPSKLGLLSRPVAGTRGSTLLVTLPGSPRAAQQQLAALLPLLPRAVALMSGDA